MAGPLSSAGHAVAFATPELYDYLEDEGFRFAIRLKPNPKLCTEIQHLLKRPVGRPSRKPLVRFHSLLYQAETWMEALRGVAKLERHRGELFPRIGFIVTNLSQSPSAVVRFYNGRGLAEQWIKDGKGAVKWTKLSCHDFDDNQVRLQLFVLAYNLGNFLRRLALPRWVGHWSLTTLLEKLVKIGAKVVSHVRYVKFQMAKVAVPRRLYATIFGRIRRVAMVPG